jgi:uncharacterized protein (DUF1501 family)
MNTEPQCCADYERAATSRRGFLGALAAAGAVGVTTSMFGDVVRQTSYAATRGGNVMVVVSFRGGIDGLGMVVPHSDEGYNKQRSGIAVPRSSLWAQDATFGLHPKLAPLKWLWDAGELAAVQAVGLPVPNRSHFSAMEAVEDADPGSSLRRGWVNRMAGIGGDASYAVHLGDATPPTIVEGPAPTVAAGSLADIQLALGADEWGTRRRRQLDTMWAGTSGALGTAARSAMSTVRSMAPVGAKAYKPAVTYPREWGYADFSDVMKDTAKLIKADIGTQVVSVDYGNWDHHDSYGVLEWGDYQRMVEGFAKVTSAFLKDLGPLRSRVTVVTISEFGRRVDQNGSGGLDHGWGNMMLVLGGGVKQSGYFGRWPGLKGADGQLLRELPVTTDYRSVLGEVVHKRFPGRDVTKVFPGVSTSSHLKIMR